jgi:hypothetical protein
MLRPVSMCNSGYRARVQGKGDRCDYRGNSIKHTLEQDSSQCVLSFGKKAVECPEGLSASSLPLLGEESLHSRWMMFARQSDCIIASSIRGAQAY